MLKAGPERSKLVDWGIIEDRLVEGVNSEDDEEGGTVPIIAAAWSVECNFILFADSFMHGK